MNLPNLLLALQQAMRGYYTPLADKLTAIITGITAHVQRTDNPHQVNKVHVGLERVQNLPVATKAQATAGTSNSAYMTPMRTNDTIDANVLTPLAALFDAAADDLG